MSKKVNLRQKNICPLCKSKLQKVSDRVVKCSDGDCWYYREIVKVSKPKRKKRSKRIRKRIKKASSEKIKTLDAFTEQEDLSKKKERIKTKKSLKNDEEIDLEKIDLSKIGGNKEKKKGNKKGNKKEKSFQEKISAIGEIINRYDKKVEEKNRRYIIERKNENEFTITRGDNEKEHYDQSIQKDIVRNRGKYGKFEEYGEDLF